MSASKRRSEEKKKKLQRHCKEMQNCYKLFLVNYQFSSFCMFFFYITAKRNTFLSYDYGLSDHIHVTGFYFGNLRLKINSFTDIFQRLCVHFQKNSTVFPTIAKYLFSECL